MIIFHNYSRLYTKKLIEEGMAQKGDGFKITQHYCSKPEMKFNEVAKKGGELYNIVKEYGSCFYIDRLQGGTFFSFYPFSEELQEEYNEITDGGYLGVQLHELGETRLYDWFRIKGELDKTGLPWTEENILESVRAISHNKEFPHFSQGPAGEYAERKLPEKLREFYDDIDYVIKTRMERFGGKIINCDSCAIYPGLEKENDIPLSLVEIGGLTADTNYQIALRRGMSCAAGKKWGVYLEPWGIDGELSAYCFMKNGENEWNCTKENFSFEAKCGNGGTSMSFAKRMMYYSLFAGTDYFSEEWGQSNTFYDFESFVLSPYGKIKKEFFALSRQFNSVKPVVPIAVVVPHEYKILNTQIVYPFENDIYDKEYSEMFKSMKSLFSDGVKIGFEDIYFTTGIAGGLIDIIYDDSYEGKPPYDLIIDYSSRMKGENVLDAYSCNNLKERVKVFVDSFLPVKIESTGSKDIQLFENNGSKYICIYNHNGISKNLKNGEIANHDADIFVTAKTKQGRFGEIINICDCSFNLNESKTEINTFLDAGKFILIQY